MQIAELDWVEELWAVPEPMKMLLLPVVFFTVVPDPPELLPMKILF